MVVLIIGIGDYGDGALIPTINNNNQFFTPNLCYPGMLTNLTSIYLLRYKEDKIITNIS